MTRRIGTLSLVLGLALAMAGAQGCGGDDGAIPADPPPPVVDGKTDAPLPDAPAYLEVYALDIWGQPLPRTGTTLGVANRGSWLEVRGYPKAMVPLKRSGTYHVRLTAPHHEHLDLDLGYDGQAAATSLSVGKPEGGVRHGVASSHETRTINGRSKPVYTLYAGLRHKWFSAQGRPARRGNAVEMLMNGEETWQRVRGDLLAAKDEVLISTWWWESNFELVRDAATHITASEAERWPNTILGTLEQIPAERRVLVGQFWGQDSVLSWMSSDAKLRRYAERTGDRFEFMGQANETEGVFWFEPLPFRFGDRVRAMHPEASERAFGDEEPVASTIAGRTVDLTKWPLGTSMELASYHQKFMVVDHDVAYIGGMNLRRTDWDTSEHKVFEPRRMLFSATQEQREAVAQKQAWPDTGPRKDYVVRIEGPAAQDAADIFHERWAYLREAGVEYSSTTTDFAVVRDIAEREGGLQVQVTATLPEPFLEHAIAETWFNAVAQAKDYIYIEDQYFRIPMLVDAIIARMKAVPTLKLVVVTKPINEWTDPGCEWTYKTVAQLRAEVGDRFTLLQLRSFDWAVTWGIDETEGYFADIDVHAKNLVVDDTFLSIGSANKNNRGIVYEGELNVAVLDETFVREARRRMLAAILPPGVTPADSADEWIEQLRDAAAWNDAVYRNWDAQGFDISLDGQPLPEEYIPRGFVYSLSFRDSSYCFIEGVSPDLF